MLLKSQVPCLLTFLFLPKFVQPNIVYDFPALEKWTNSLDNDEKLTAFLASKNAFARERVFAHQEEGQQKEACLGSTEHKLIHALQRFKSSRKSHQIMLVFEKPNEFREAFSVLTLMQHKWIWLHFPIVQGPYDDLVPVALNEFNEKELALMRSFQLSFGFTATARDFGSGEYLKEQMLSLADRSDEWFNKLEIQTSFMMEIGMHVLLNTSDMVRVMEPLFQREVFICYATTMKHKDFVLSHMGYMDSLGKLTMKGKLFLNVPAEVFKQLNPQNWFPDDGSSGTMLRIVQCCMVMISVVGWTVAWLLSMLI